MSKKYVVFVGRQTGIFDSWQDCEKQIIGFSGAIFKRYSNIKEANDEFDKFNKNKSSKGSTQLNYAKPNTGICSDASYLTSKNILEYRVVDIKTKNVLHHKIFHSQSKYLNNIGEFFALIRAIKHVLDHKLEVPIYSDSVVAIKWVKEKKVKTTCIDDEFLSKIQAGIDYLNSIELPTIVKWQTNIWGEIPADFGRK